MIAEPLSVAHLLARTWWLVLLRGLAAILFGALALLWPHLTLVILVILYAVYALSDGVFALAEALRGGGLIPLRSLSGKAFSSDRSKLAGPSGYCAWGCSSIFVLEGCRRPTCSRRLRGRPRRCVPCWWCRECRAARRRR